MQWGDVGAELHDRRVVGGVGERLYSLQEDNAEWPWFELL